MADSATEASSLPAISLVMPTKNSATYIHEALESLRRQTFQNYELIICDSSSKDSTLAILGEAKDVRLRIVSYSDRSIPEALNRGFSAAFGHVLCWLNSDDVLVSRYALENVYHAFNSNEVHVAVGDFVTLTSCGFIVRKLYFYPPILGFPQTGGNLFTGSLFFSRFAWYTFGGFSCRHRYAFEYELTAALLSAFYVAHIDAALGGFRMRPDGLSTVYSKAMAEEKRRIYSEYKDVPALNMFAHRIHSHFRRRHLIRVLFNSLSRPYSGSHWSLFP